MSKKILMLCGDYGEDYETMVPCGRDHLSVPQLLSVPYDELLEQRGDIPNFSSFLRVSCLRYRTLQVDQRIPRDISIPIRSLNAHAVLRGLRPSLVEASAG